MLNAHHRTYAVVWVWIRRVIVHAMLLNHIGTCFGWRLQVTGNTRPTALWNHPMQSHGAEMLRLACCYLTEVGMEVCAPVHDAALIEAAEEEIEAKVVQARALMG